MKVAVRSDGGSETAMRFWMTGALNAADDPAKVPGALDANLRSIVPPGYCEAASFGDENPNLLVLLRSITDSRD